MLYSPGSWRTMRKPLKCATRSLLCLSEKQPSPVEAKSDAETD